MKRWLASFSFFALIFILTHAACAQECADTTGKQHHAPLTTTLKRGINISRWWEDSRDQFPTDQDFSLIVESGFDFIRLPVSPVWFTADNPQITQLHCDLVKLTSLGLRVIVDLHAHGAFKERQVDASEDEAVHNIMAVWERIAPALKDLPQDQILVETYNEPGIKTATWWSIQGQLVQQLRHLFPKNDIVATTGPVSGTWEYAHLTAYTDPHVYYDFHFYSPMVFTHHKAPWIDSFKPGQGYAPVVYPYDPSFEWDTSDEMVKQYAEEKWHKENMRKYADDITKWATQN
ncbi:MAG: cellulase family glycosylhydrolase, partial [Alphaproteobacteria bacterium]|nr:cellulase family glycosylhydrolase [Alphaproteobacteria bacterium]